MNVKGFIELHDWYAHAPFIVNVNAIESVEDRFIIYAQSGHNVDERYDEILKLMGAAESVRNAPTVDAVEVVRCRECKDYRPASDGHGGEMHYGFCINRHDETCKVTRNRYERDFCSYGVRKGR